MMDFILVAAIALMTIIMTGIASWASKVISEGRDQG